MSVFDRALKGSRKSGAAGGADARVFGDFVAAFAAFADDGHAAAGDEEHEAGEQADGEEHKAEDEAHELHEGAEADKFRLFDDAGLGGAGLRAAPGALLLQKWHFFFFCLVTLFSVR
jgi:hypothetical protein